LIRRVPDFRCFSGVFADNTKGDGEQAAYMMFAAGADILADNPGLKLRITPAVIVVRRPAQDGGSGAALLAPAPNQNRAAAAAAAAASGPSRGRLD